MFKTKERHKKLFILANELVPDRSIKHLTNQISIQIVLIKLTLLQYFYYRMVNSTIP